MQNESTVPGDNAKITACHHVAICVHDIDKARDFYGIILWLEEVPRPPEIADKFRSAWYRIGQAELHVVENQEFQPLDSPLGPHIAVVSNDFPRLTDQILERGGKFRFGPAPGPDGILRAIIVDPTGNTLEITSAPLRS